MELTESKLIYSIEYLKSSLSINTHIGCGMGCVYCSIQSFVDDKPQFIISVEELIQALKKNLLFVPHVTPITINNRTDPFLPSVKEYTLSLLHEFRKKELTNPLIIITKMEISANDIEYMEKLNLNLFIIISYSNLSSVLEPKINSMQLKTFENMKKRKSIKVLHYWRPLLEGLNDAEESIQQVFDTVYPVCDGSIISGIRLNSSIIESLNKVGVCIEGWNGDVNHKYLPNNVIERIVSIKNNYYSDYPLFRHTSCGISYLLNKCDYNFHFANNGGGSCMQLCPNKVNCSVGQVPEESSIINLFQKFNIHNKWQLKNDFLYIEGNLNEQLKSAVLHSLCFPVVVQFTEKSPSELEITR